MSEPFSGFAAGAAGFKAAGGAAGALGIGAAIASVVVMTMTPPRSAREWSVGLISTVVGSIAGGAAVIEHFGLQAWMHSFTGLLAVLGIAFACGLPAWALVRAGFTWLEKRQGKDLGELIKDAKELV